MIGTSFKNSHAQEKELYPLENMYNAIHFIVTMSATSCNLDMV